MARYTIRFVNHGDRVFGTDEMECACDEEIITRARRIHSHGIGKGYEIWEGERRVHSETHR